MKGNCNNCGNVVLEGNGYCDSERCLREAREYEQFNAMNGNHCPTCFEVLRFRTVVTEPEPEIAETRCPECACHMKEVDESIYYCGSCGTRHKL
ncbi:MAG: hypothetical protein KKH41_01585 [Candidatus Thermoplasmatota archaeon]|nr:hypothetical protein [Euryarchaeota archaeon]MBU4031866.1 hypothetical protein [Candidatus Thermoplasmatota archaeon]MBU4070692.1 hypothetical protein [Candidatus Thermoplasmatota archaeon]MBU4145264.1 hypothetical protein [Candidatus Thermoplasmatota archaeon]MBU4591254.1 hypothetical protein [Candidatus Thermoplasmatota archaeon]